ncbi:Large polyvalent protein-associated domain-containing protein, partial [Dysosmobacter welbionis]
NSRAQPRTFPTVPALFLAFISSPPRFCAWQNSRRAPAAFCIFPKYGSTGAAHPQLCGHHRDLGDVRLPCQQRLEPRHAQLPHPAAVDVDGGELRLQHPAGGAVVQSRHRQVFRHPQAQAEGGLHGSGGHHVVSAEDGRGPVLPGQQLQAGLCGTLHRGIAQLDVPGVCRQAVGLGDFQ